MPDAKPQTRAPRKRAHGSIWRRFVLLLVVTLMPMLGLLAGIYAARYQTRRDREFQANLEVARAVARACEEFVNDVGRQERVLGNALITLTPFSPERANRLLSLAARHQPAVEQLHWVSPQRRVLASSNPRVAGTDMRRHAYFRMPHAGETYASDLSRTPDTGEWRFAIQTGIAGARGELAGVVSARVVPQRLGEAGIALRRLEAGGVSLVDRNGLCVFRYAPPAPYSVGEDWGKQYPQLAPALRGHECMATVADKTMRGQRRIVAFAPVRSIGWAAGAGRPEAASLASIRRDLDRDIALFLLVDLVALTVALVISSGITAPMRRLQADARRLGTGDLAHRAAGGGPGEVGDLAAAFNAMAVRIQEQTETLQAAHGALQVQNEELASANEELEVQRQELACANEELQVQREGLQVANEELTSQAAELRAQDERLRYLASYPERNPNPVVETDLAGSVTYANPATLALFPDLLAAGPAHPFLAGIEALATRLRQEGAPPLLSRDIRCGDLVFSQAIAYVGESQTLRVYCFDATERKQAEERTRALQEVTAALSAALTPDEVGDAALNEGARAVGAATAVVALLVGDARELEVVSCHGLPAGAQMRNTRSSLDNRRIGTDAVRTGRPVVVSSLADFEAAYPESVADARGVGLQSAAALPLVVGSRVIGVIVFTFTDPQEFAAAKMTFLEAIAGQTAQALERARLHEEAERRALELQAQHEELASANEELQVQREGLQVANEELTSQAAELRAQDERLRYLASFPERNPRPVVETDLAGNVTYANPASLALFPDLLAAGPAHPVLAGIEALAIRLRQEGAPPLSRDVRCGDLVLTQNLAYLPESQTLRVYCFDATERTRAEDALREREADLRDAQRVAHVGSWYWDARTDATTGSDELLRIYGLDPASDVMPSFSEQRGTLYPVEAWERVSAAVQRTMQTGVGYELDVEAIRNGAPIWITTRSEVVRDPGGSLVGLRGTVQDISERKRADDALRESEAKYRDLFENMTEEVHFWRIVRDDDGQIRTWRLVDANPPALRTWGKTLDETLGRTTDEIFGPGASAHYMPVVRRIMAEGVPFGFEDYFPHLGKHFRFTSVPLGDHFITTGADITHIVKANEALKAADRRKDEFLAMLGHELRNPLAAIAGAVQLLQAPAVPAPALQRARDAAARQTAHMARLLDDLLDVSRVTQGKIALHKDVVALAPVIESAIEATRLAAESRGHELFASLPREPLWLDADPVRLAQVIANLLDNAAKYTPPGGEIRLRVECDSGDGSPASLDPPLTDGASDAPQATHPWVAIRVRDNGIGMAPELMAHVFDVFVQGERGVDRSEGGLGIGLALVRSLVEMHGGRVDAHSAGPGQGSEFAIHLPLADLASEAGGQAPMPAPEPLRILVVDDNPDAAEMTAALLELDGHEVVTAHSGPEALAILGVSGGMGEGERGRGGDADDDGSRSATPPHSHTPTLPHPSWDVVLLDIGMPGMDGYEVARRLRQDPALAGMLLVALTGYGEDEHRERSREAGFTHHMLKPVDTEALRRVLSEVPAARS